MGDAEDRGGKKNPERNALRQDDELPL